MAKPKICTQCHTIGTGKSVMRGSIGMEIVLWCFFGVGIFYSVWRHTTRQTVCAACRQPTLIPVQSPQGHRLLQQREPVTTTR